MNAMGTDYWREMKLVVPTRELVIQRQNEDVKFEASVISSSLILPENKIFPQADFEPSLLELRLQVPESGLLFRADLVVATYVSGVGNFFTSKGNLEAAACLNDQIRSGKNPIGVFGGRIDIAQTFMRGAAKYLSFKLHYAEFPKDSGIAYIFDRNAPLVKSQ